MNPQVVLTAFVACIFSFATPILSSDREDWLTRRYETLCRESRPDTTRFEDAEGYRRYFHDRMAYKFRALKELAQECLPSTWENLTDRDIETLGDLLLETHEFASAVQLANQFDRRGAISISMHRVKTRALIYLGDVDRASAALKDSGEGDGGGRLGELRLPLMVLAASRNNMSDASLHGRQAMLHLQWQAENEPANVMAVSLWIQTFANAIRQDRPDRVRAAMTSIVLGAENACNCGNLWSAQGRVRMVVHREMAFWASCEGRKDLAERQLEEWIELLSMDLAWRPEDRLVAFDRLFTTLEEKSEWIREQGIPLTSSLSRLHDSLADSLPGETIVRRRRLDLQARCKLLAERSREERTP